MSLPGVVRTESRGSVSFTDDSDARGVGLRSLRNLVLPLGQLNLVTGANGTGKSSLYRALRLLGDAALNTVVASLAREGGLPSTLWAGPETIARSVRKGDFPVEGTPRQKSVSLKLGFAGDPYSYCIDLG